MPDATVYRWDDLETDHPMALIDRKRVIGEQMMVSHVTLHEGFSVPPHAHDNEQIAIVLSGRLRFRIGEEGREVVLGPGELVHLPSNVLHGADAIERTVVLDLFSPPSEVTGVDAHA